MKVSVIVPAYNVAGKLERAIDSIIGTEYPHLEIVIVEDGSVDDTLAVARAIEERDPHRIRLLSHGTGVNRGAGASRNTGIIASTGDLIAFLDADDWYLPWRFELAVRMLMGNSELDGVYETTQVVHGDHQPESGASVALSEGPEPYGVLRGLFASTWSTNAITLRRAVFSRVGLFNENLTLGQDGEFWIRLAALTNLRPGDKRRPVAVYSRHSENRYQTDFDRDEKNRVRLWMSAFSSLASANASPEAMTILKNGIVGKCVYKSNSLRRKQMYWKSLCYLGWCVRTIPSLVVEKKFAKECVMSGLNLFNIKRSTETELLRSRQ